jgi:hypothetical protein
MYREAQENQAICTPKIDRSYRRALSEWNGNGAAYSAIILYAAFNAAFLALILTPEPHLRLAAVIAVVGVVATLISPFVWAHLAREQLEKEWIAQAIADERAIAILVHGDERRSIYYNEERRDLSA